MNRQTARNIAAILAASLAGLACNKPPEDPEQNAADIAKIIRDAEAKVNRSAAEAVQEHLERVADANGQPLSGSAMKKDIDNLYRIDIELAEANHKVAREKCDTRSGETKNQCLTLAKADYEAALAQAAARKTGAKAEIEHAQPRQ